MRDPYVYEYSDVLKNLANIRDKKTLDKMEADYTCLRLAQIATDNPLISYEIDDFKRLHHFIFGDVYEWAGEFRTINIEKEEPALGGISIEYSDFKNIHDEVKEIIEYIQSTKWNELDEKSLVTTYANCLSRLWKIHPFREGNTRTIITFFELMIEENYIYIDSDLLKDNANYVRTSLVAANAVFYDIGDKRNCEYLENIITHAFINGRKLKEEIICNMMEVNVEVTDANIQEVIFESRKQNHILQRDEIVCYVLTKKEVTE